MSAAAFKAALEARDLDAMVACLSEEVRLHSPIAFRPFEGREAVRALFDILLNHAFADFRYTDQMEGEGVHALIFRARVGDKDLEGIDILRPGTDGLIDDFTVMVRPRSALEALMQAVGARLVK